MSQTNQRPCRVLVIGQSTGPEVLRIARGIPPGGMLICIEGDRAAAARASDAFAREGLRQAHVMVGDPALFIGKVAGPFDLIAMLVDEVTAGRLEPHLERLLAPGGHVIRQGGGTPLG